MVTRDVDVGPEEANPGVEVGVGEARVLTEQVPPGEDAGGHVLFSRALDEKMRL